MNEEMSEELKSWSKHAQVTLALAAAALWMVAGEARGSVDGGPATVVRAGEVLSHVGGVAQTRVADAKQPPQGQAAPAASAAAKAEGPCGSCVEIPKPVDRTILDGASPTRGPAHAPVTIVEYTDYQCSFCRKVNDTMLEIERLYGERVRFVFKQAPLASHPSAHLAAEAVLAAAEQGHFWDYRGLLYYGSGELPDRQGLEAYASKLGLDLTRFRRALDSGKYTAQVDGDLAEAVRNTTSVDADGKAKTALGTPLFYINGRALPGAQPLERFVKLIDEELAAQEK
jgi:protein-disulfide isomerase